MDPEREVAVLRTVAGAPPEAIIASFRLAAAGAGAPADLADLDGLRDALARALAAAGAGAVDGVGRGRGFLRLYASGPSAEALFAAAAPVLRAFPAPPGSYVVKRYGGPGAPEARVDL